MTTLRLRPDLEDALRSLPDVQAVSVVTSGDAVPTEVHVLAAPGKAAKQVVRDVQSMAMAGFDIDIDHRIVSVVQIGEQDVTDSLAASAAAMDSASGAGPNPGTPRPLVVRIGLSTSLKEASATVTLRMGEDEFSGHMAGSPVAAARARMVANATVLALAELVGSGCQVETAEIVPLGEREVAVVVLVLEVPRIGAQLLSGSALVRAHAEDAVARAVLDALNRHLAG